MAKIVSVAPAVSVACSRISIALSLWTSRRAHRARFEADISREKKEANRFDRKPYSEALVACRIWHL
jgi:hypothetical protein